MQDILRCSSHPVQTDVLPFIVLWCDRSVMVS